MKTNIKQILGGSLSIIAIIALMIISLGFIKRDGSGITYQQSSDQILNDILQRNEVILPNQTMAIIFGNDTNYQFIDLRTPDEFSLAHIDGAINIPVHEILKPDNKAILHQDKKVNILYGNETIDACSPWMLLQQIGYKNNRILMGGFILVNQNILKNYNPLSAAYRDEQARYDYKKISESTAGSASMQSGAPLLKPMGTNKKKKRVKGGC